MKEDFHVRTDFCVSPLQDAYNAFLKDRGFRSLRERVRATGPVYYEPVILGQICVVYLRTDKATPVLFGEIR